MWKGEGTSDGTRRAHTPRRGIGIKPSSLTSNWQSSTCIVEAYGQKHRLT